MAQQPPITAVYLVLRTDFDHHTDRKGCMAQPIGAFITAEAATAAARRHVDMQADKGRRNGCGEEPEHGVGKDELYGAWCYTREDRRDHFNVVVKAMKLGDAAAGGSGPSKKRKVTATEAAGDDGGHGAGPSGAATGSAANKSNAVATGKHARSLISMAARTGTNARASGSTGTPATGKYAYTPATMDAMRAALAPASTNATATATATASATKQDADVFVIDD